MVDLAVARPPTLPEKDTTPHPVSRRPVSRVTRRRRLAPGKRWRFASFVGPLAVLAAWSLVSVAGLTDPRVLPAPWTVLTTLVRLWTDGTLASDILTSLTRAGAGFAGGLVLGVVLALLAGLSRAGDALIDGTVQVKRAIPTLGLIPLLILWLGIGESFKIVTIALGVFVPIYINLVAALQGIDNKYVELAQVAGLNRWQFIREVVFPGALPGFFTGLRLSVTISWLALVVLEQINATSGLGYLMYQAQNYGQVDVIMVGLLIYAVFGFVTDLGVRALERRSLSWRRGLST